jgi:hypothetical protein
MQDDWRGQTCVVVRYKIGSTSVPQVCQPLLHGPGDWCAACCLCQSLLVALTREEMHKPPADQTGSPSNKVSHESIRTEYQEILQCLALDSVLGGGARKPDSKNGLGLFMIPMVLGAIGQSAAEGITYLRRRYKVATLGSVQ